MNRSINIRVTITCCRLLYSRVRTQKYPIGAKLFSDLIRKQKPQLDSDALESKSMKSVLIIYTGGTMGMKVDENGSLAPVPGYLTERILSLPELYFPKMPKFAVKEYSPLLDSSCMGPDSWAQIATDIEDNYLKYDGFVVIMGTDTMAYASSALSFILENLGKPVIFTGSQIPFSEVYNDARRNLLVSIIFAMSYHFPEVCIFFNDKLLRANRSVKVNSKSLSAFDSPNFPPLATMGVHIDANVSLALPQPRAPFRVHKHLEAKVLVLKLVPGFDDECIQATIRHSTQLKAIVLEMYGTGNGPSNKGPLLDAIKEARERGIVVVAVSQCLCGGVALDKVLYLRAISPPSFFKHSFAFVTTTALLLEYAVFDGSGVSQLWSYFRRRHDY